MEPRFWTLYEQGKDLFYLAEEADRYQMAFWIANGVADIATQLVVALAPIYLLYHLNIQAANKRVAFLSFMPNITYAWTLDHMLGH